MVSIYSLYFWRLRQRGLNGRVEEEISEIQESYPRRYLQGPIDVGDVRFRRIIVPLHLERAWAMVARAEWASAEGEIDRYLQEVPALGEHYDVYLQARLAKGFCLDRRGDRDGAVRSWKDATFSGFHRRYPSTGSESGPRVPPRGRQAVLGHWIAASLANDLTDADAHDLWTVAVGQIASDPLAAQTASAIEVSPAVVRGMWSSPRGRDLARQMTVHALRPYDHFRTPIRLLGYEMLR